MRISIITATLNNATTIADTLDSVKSQTYNDIEHIIIDGKSTDKTLKIIEQYTHISKIVSEPDEGIYSALNKGISLSTGDVIGFLHADDFFFSSNVLNTIAKAFIKHSSDAIYTDLQYIAKNNPEKIIRNWISSTYSPDLLSKGWMPAHPTFYVKKIFYKKYGLFDTKYKISADYDLMLRFLQQDINVAYIPEFTVKMRLGGISNKNIRNIFKKLKEDYSIIKRHRIGNFFTLLRKNMSKLHQLILIDK